MRAFSLGPFSIVAPLALVAIVPLSCASQTSIDGSGGNGGAGSAATASSGTTTTSSSSVAQSSSGSVGGCTIASDCATMNDQCNAGACVNGTCVRGPANENQACDDNDFCTQNETCKSGVCGGGSPTICPTNDACHIGVCDKATQACSVTPGNDGGQCDDGDPCTLQGTCSAGTCAKGPPVDCSVFNGTCTVGACDPQLGCVPMPQNDGTGCDDGLFCTVNDKCVSGKCTGDPNICAPPNSPCLVGSCDEAQKKCTNVPAPNGTACDDQSSCTTGTTCNNGVCSGGQPANQGGACNDGKACTSGDACNAGVCSGTSIVSCVSNDGCCPVGCSMANDSDCTCNVNIALTATGKMSVGGAPPMYGPEQMNNQIGKATCNWAWVNNSSAPSGAYFEYDWPAPVTIGSFYIETDPGLMQGPPPCNSPAGRNLAGATVQYWDGAAWVTSTSWSGQHGDVKIDLPSPVTTTKLRLFDVTTDAPGNNSLIYEWHVYQGTGCMPPP